MAAPLYCTVIPDGAVYIVEVPPRSLIGLFDAECDILYSVHHDYFLRHMLGSSLTCQCEPQGHLRCTST